MKIIQNKILPGRRFAAINILGILFVRKGVHLDERLMRHEAIHTSQMKYMLYVFFYIVYFLEWLVRLIQYRSAMKAYYNISFEREAYANDGDASYLKYRRPYAWLKYIV